MKIYKIAQGIEPTEIDKPFEKPKWRSIWENSKLIMDGKPIVGKPDWAEDEEPHMDNAEKAYQLALNDHQFNQLYNKIRYKTKDYGYTSPSENKFSFHAPLKETLDIINQQGWEVDRHILGRTTYYHPLSNVRIMRAEGDAFVVIIEPKKENVIEAPKQLKPIERPKQLMP